MANPNAAVQGKGWSLSRFVPLILLTTIFSLNFLLRVILGPVLPVLEVDLNLNHSEAGLLFLYLSFGYCLSLLGSGFVSSYLTHHWTIILSAAAVGVFAIVVMASQSFSTLSLALIGLGLASGLYIPSGIPTVTTLFPQRNWSRALAIHEVGPNLSFVAAPVLIEAFVTRFSWRVAFGVVGAASLLSALAFIYFGKGGDFRGQLPRPSAVRALLTKSSFWIISALLILGIGASFAIYSILPIYLVTERESRVSRLGGAVNRRQTPRTSRIRTYNAFFLTRVVHFFMSTAQCHSSYFTSPGEGAKRCSANSIQ